MYAVGFSQVEYPVHEDAKSKKGVPRGKVLGPFSHKSEVFPETERPYYIYVPNQYRKESPAALLVSFDGYNMAVNKWQLPTILDNLIHLKELPPMIGVFIGVGVQKSETEGTYDRPIRSVEYDSRSKETATMVIEEIIPKVKAKYTISEIANDHMIAGNSSGGNAAFSVAWHRPDFFSKVFSGVGSFTSLRDGHQFLTLVRKTEHKPLRIYLQDGSNDLNNFSGHWFNANKYMLSSLQWAGYEVNYTWGEDTHGYRHAAAIMPDILRWLWKDYPKPVAMVEVNSPEKQILRKGEYWKKVTASVSGNVALTTNEWGELFYWDAIDHTLNKLWKDGSSETIATYGASLAGLALSANRELCSCNPSEKEIVALWPKKRVVAKGVECDNLVFTQKGIYFLHEATDTFGFYPFKNGSVVTFNTIIQPKALSLSAEQSFLNITNGRSVHGYSVGLKADGTPKVPLPFFYYSTAYSAPHSESRGITVDVENQTYTATAVGVQVADQLGRTRMITPLPDGSIPLQLVFGGSSGDRLYAVSDTGIFVRTMYQRGAFSWDNPVVPTKPFHVKPLKK